MRKQKNTSSSLFLIELMIAVLFFSLGSAVCIRVFAKAYQINEDARRLSFASVQTSSAASALKYTDGSASSMKRFFPLISEEGQQLIICYDKNFQPCTKQDCFFTMSVTTEQQEFITRSCISFSAKDRKDPVYNLELQYVPFSGSSDEKQQSEGTGRIS